MTIFKKWCTIYNMIEDILELKEEIKHLKSEIAELRQIVQEKYYCEDFIELVEDDESGITLEDLKDICKEKRYAGVTEKQLQKVLKKFDAHSVSELTSVEYRSAYYMLKKLKKLD